MATKNIGSSLLLSGGTMTGGITLSVAPTTNLEAVTKAYVDSKGGGGTFATAADQVAYTSTTAVITPYIQTFSQASLQARGSFYYDGANVVMQDAFNVISITRVSTGDYIIAWTNALVYNSGQSDTFGALCGTGHYGAGNSGPLFIMTKAGTFTGTQCEILCFTGAIFTNTYTLVDPGSTSPVSFILAGKVVA